MLTTRAVSLRPINDQIAVWTESSIPPSWTEFRDRWENLHLLVAIFGIIGTSTLIIAYLPKLHPASDRSS
jgi:hypothetical protein